MQLFIAKLKLQTIDDELSMYRCTHTHTHIMHTNHGKIHKHAVQLHTSSLPVPSKSALDFIIDRLA